jgi:hypothetical protein
MILKAGFENRIELAWRKVHSPHCGQIALETAVALTYGDRRLPS